MEHPENQCSECSKSSDKSEALKEISTSTESKMEHVSPHTPQNKCFSNSSSYHRQETAEPDEILHSDASNYDSTRFKKDTSAFQSAGFTMSSEDSLNPSHEQSETAGCEFEQDRSSRNSSDEYVSSDDDFSDLQGIDEQRHTFLANSSVAEHVAYFEKSLNETLDSLRLDDSLVLQAQLSGHLNKKSAELHEKQLQIATKIRSLKQLYKDHIADNRIGKLEADIKSINTRVDILTTGVSRKSVFGSSKKLGVSQKYPVEFNKAKDKILERVQDL